MIRIQYHIGIRMLDQICHFDDKCSWILEPPLLLPSNPLGSWIQRVQCLQLDRGPLTSQILAVCTFRPDISWDSHNSRVHKGLLFKPSLNIREFFGKCLRHTGLESWLNLCFGPHIFSFRRRHLSQQTQAKI